LPQLPHGLLHQAILLYVNQVFLGFVGKKDLLEEGRSVQARVSQPLFLDTCAFAFPHHYHVTRPMWAWWRSLLRGRTLV